MIPTYDEIADALETLNEQELDKLVGAIIATHVIRGADSADAALRVKFAALGGQAGSDAFDEGER